MSKTASVVEINGVRYDAGTGRAIGKVKNFARARLSASSQVIDGFVKRKQEQPKSSSAKRTTSKTVKKEVRQKPVVNRVVSTTARNIHHQKERSKTLVRSVVSKPNLRIKEVSRSLTSSNFITKRSTVDVEKIQKASLTQKSSRVSKFTPHKKVSDVSSPVQVGEVITRPINHNGQRLNSSSRGKDTVMPSMVASASHQHLERLLDAALFSASSHRESLRKGRSSRYHRAFFYVPKWISVTIAIVIIILAIFLFAWRNIPVVATRIAGAQANIDASAPVYTPVGFSYHGPAKDVNGAVEITYRNNLDISKTYKITEAKSQLNSASLGSNVNAVNSQMLTSQINGNTVYIYDDSKIATWVNNSIQYSIENNAGLGSDQLLKIVNSIH